MSHWISFPGFNISPFKVDPVAFNLFGRDVMWYGVILTTGIILAVLSLKLSDQIWHPLERFGVHGLMHSVISPDEVAAHKPEPDGIFYLSEKTGIALSDILYVGDSITDMKTAQNAGVDFAAVCTGATSAERFAELGAGMIYPTFADLCRAICEL